MSAMSLGQAGPAAWARLAILRVPDSPPGKCAGRPPAAAYHYVR